MINATHVTKSFEGFTSLSDISITIPDGSIYGLVGSNGAGKSTLLRALCGIYDCEGNITIDNIPVYDNPTAKGLICFVPDDPYLINIASVKKMRSLYANTHIGFDKKRFDELITLFKLPTNKPLSTFSKGMKRQVAIALALSCDNKYLFFDETFDGLDPVVRAAVKRIICDEVAANKRTILLTSHSLRELEDLCDELALIHEGKLILESSLDKLNTLLVKVQISLAGEYDENSFEELEIVKFSKRGSTAHMLIKGEEEEVRSKLLALNPQILDILPLNLDEVFTYELSALGYASEMEEL